MSMFMQGSRSPLFRVGLRADSSWYTVNVSTWTWGGGQTDMLGCSKTTLTCFVVSLWVRSYLVALDQDALHLFEQVLQVPVAQSLDDLHQSSPRHVTDLLETVPQHHAHLHQDPG